MLRRRAPSLAKTVAFERGALRLTSRMRETQSSVRSILELVDLAVQCSDPAEYDRGRSNWLERHIGCDKSYIGEATPGHSQVQPQVSGISSKELARCESQVARYLPEITKLNLAAELSGGTIVDHDVLSEKMRDRSPFYREVVHPLGIRCAAISVLRFRQQTIGCLYIGRVAGASNFRKELALLRKALPALAMGKRLFDLSGKSRAALPPHPFTRRENQVLDLLTKGFTNQQIATFLNSSPLTVKNQVSSMLAKAGVKNRAELVYFSVQIGVLAKDD